MEDDLDLLRRVRRFLGGPELRDEDYVDQSWSGIGMRFDPIKLLDNMEKYFDSIPLNSCPFGGDGCYSSFCFLDSPGYENGNKPVFIFSTNTCDGMYIFLGESLREFLDLCLPLACGGFCDFAFDPCEFFHEYLPAWERVRQDRGQMDPRMRTFANAFGLKPWPEVICRLAELNLRYLPVLDVVSPYPVFFNLSEDLKMWRKIEATGGDLKKIFPWRYREPGEPFRPEDYGFD